MRYDNGNWRADLVSFFRNLFRRGAAPSRVGVAAFGKHPGWDDHLEIGVDTDLLAAVKQGIYVEGIGGNIESGAWDKLQENQRVKEFAHIFLWRREHHLVAGRLWSSRDGKGRSRYPMVCVADCSGMPLRRVVEKVFPSLERIESKCTQTDSESVVREIISAAGTELRLLAAASDHASAAATTSDADVLRHLAQCLGGPDHRKLFSVLYQIETEMSGYRSAADIGSSSVMNIRPTQLRVPVCADPPAEAALLWLRFLLTQFDDAAPFLVLQPLAEPWVDLIVGEPTASQIYCMMATPAAVPLTTDIPYNLPTDFIERASRLIGAAGAGFAPVAGPVAAAPGST